MTNYLGGWIRHSGWYPDYKVRLYRRDHGKFVSVLHEGVKLDGPAGRLERPPASLHGAILRGAQGQAGFSHHHGAPKTCFRAAARAGGRP